ncbi:hypothetical protein F5X68DRAFT_228209 [Plectosphaerella plurivora]|uniref:Uncharacterized protein n=1 Tax=Plectosphaerella plurivora TaxID=936078 RepID=A0A9P8VHL2_9PEZI|nr:hypothetical protein F5X68DRAFT_228209 [Plectosphaerella plurivora]
MKTTGLFATACSVMAFAVTVSAQEPLPRESATCCYGFGHQTRLVVATKGSGDFMSEGKWCMLDVDVDPQFPDDCFKATRGNPRGYCERSTGTETFPSVPC